MKNFELITVCHEDYYNDLIETVIDSITDTLKGKLGSVTLNNQTVFNTEQAISAGKNERTRNADCIVVLLATWIECDIVMTLIKELEPLPLMIWGFPITELNKRRISTGSYVSLSMFSGVIKRLGLKHKCMIGDWQKEKTIEQIRSFMAASSAVKRLKYSNVGLVGYTSMSIYTGTFDHLLMRYNIGPEIHQIDTYTLINEAEKSTDAEINQAHKYLESLGSICLNISDDMLRKTLGLYVALKKLCLKNSWDAINVKCQYELSKEYKAVPCVPLSMLAEDDVVASCEGDILNTVSMMILRYISSGTVTYGDSIDHKGNKITFSACGFLPFSMGYGKKTVCNFMPHPAFTGIQASYVMKPKRVTYMRLVEDIGSYHIICGTGQGLPTELRDSFMPALDVEIDGNIDDLVASYAGQHFAICYGDYVKEIEMFAELMGIEIIVI